MSFFSDLKNSLETADGKRAYNLGLFTRVAKDYDSVTRLMSFGKDASWKRALVAMLPPLEAARCVDIACGTGDVTMLLGEKYPNGEILGIDLTASMLDVARQRSKNAHITFAECDMCHTPISNEWADVVTGSYAIRNSPDLKAVLAEIHRILKPGGVFAFLDFHKSPNRYLALITITLLKWWGALCGLVMHGVPEHAYIAESLRSFPDAKQLRIILKENGFTLLAERGLMFGITEILALKKTDRH